MPARSNSGKATRSVLILVFILAVVIAATAAYVKFLPQGHLIPAPTGDWPTADDIPAGSHSVPMSPPQRMDDKPSFSVPTVSGDQVNLSSAKEHPADGEEPAVFLANQSLKAVHAESAKALSVKVNNRIALIDFSPEIEDGFGSSQEASFIKALQISLGQLNDVDKFQITVNGQPIDSLGHFELTDPVEVIRPTINP